MMERRQFLSMTLGAVALAAVPASVRAEDFRKSKPTVWTAKTVDDAIKAMYGSTALTMEGVKLKAPDVASNGGAIPVDFSTDKDITSIAVFQDANPEAAVMVAESTKYSVNKYSIKIKMAKSGTITVVAQGKDGKLYAAKKTLDVALGGCEG
ncbi:thiosulfate oxidation carrier protein SoxY [Sulfurimonas paralvinellae]|uniref:Thiosulfate oxidation carrier protein SoxY n=2 Tax=Sulfurimonas paralvinellae TaxID=317658 RepID=A0A7M1BCS7_9BACT|nr:thiosulfate oxidation carrier protein SoxY [Sulfurimonas paralvinellae]